MRLRTSGLLLLACLTGPAQAARQSFTVPTPMAAAGGEPARLAYYARHWSDWISAVQGVVAYFKAQPQNGGKVGLLGISLGAQIAAASSTGRSDIDGLVLVDGGFPDGFAKPVRSLPPLLLIWGGADRIFPLPIGQALQQRAQRLGASATLDVYAGGAHGFFLKAASPDAAAHRSAAEFLRARLSAHPPFRRYIRQQKCPIMAPAEVRSQGRRG